MVGVFFCKNGFFECNLRVIRDFHVRMEVVAFPRRKPPFSQHGRRPFTGGHGGDEIDLKRVVRAELFHLVVIGKGVVDGGGAF